MRILDFNIFSISEAWSHNTLHKLKGKFPWESKADHVIDEINSLFNEISKEFNYGAHHRETRSYCFEIDIKVYDTPDMEKLSMATGNSEDMLYQMWNDYLGFQVEDFIENYLLENYSWIENAHQVGRSGGWLAIEPLVSLDQHMSAIIDLFVNYNYETDHFSPITADEMKKLQSTIKAKRIGLLDSNLEQAEEAIEAEDLFNDMMKSVDLELNELKSIYQDLKEIEKEANRIMTNLPNGFVEDYLEEF